MKDNLLGQFRASSLAVYESDASTSATPVQRASSVVWAFALAALIVFLILAVWLSFTRCPWWDEGLFADVAANFRSTGHLRSSLLAPHSFDNMPAVNCYMYWQFPAYLVSLGLWFHVVPITILWMRIFSVLWGCIFVASWFFFVRTVARNETLALLAASVVALDYSSVAASSNGRMDAMCAALGQLALATYVLLRESHINRAALSIGFFGAASLFCHPMGAVTNAFIAILLWMDWRRLRWNILSIIALPYLLGGALCFPYILKAPQIFWVQARDVSGYRVGGLLFVLRNIANDFRDRYLQFYFAPNSGSHKFKIFSLLFGLVGLLAFLLHRKARSEFLPKFLLLSTGIGYLGVAALDDLKYPYYLIYVTPILSVCGAVWLYNSFRNNSFSRSIASVSLAAFFAVNIAGSAYYIHRDELASVYRPVVAEVESLLKPGDIVMGPSELGFALGFERPLIDDCTLGFASGIQPKIFVMYPACMVPGYSMFIYNWSHKKLRIDYRPVFKRGGYTVYLKNQTHN